MLAKRKKSLLQAVLYLFFSMSCFANCQGTLSNPCLVQDTSPSSPELKHFRDMTDIANVYSGNITGLKSAWVSGSGVPRADDFTSLANLIHHMTDGQATHIIDLDLRQESHGYLNGEGITLAERHDWINRGKTKTKALADEAKWLNQLRLQPTVTVLSAKNFKEGHLENGTTIPVESVQTEADLATSAHLDYERFMVTDHLPPNDASVDRFVALVDHADPKTWFHIHCRGGDGHEPHVGLHQSLCGEGGGARTGGLHWEEVLGSFV